MLLVMLGISGEFELRNDPQPKKLERWPWILVKLTSIEFCNLKLSDLSTLGNIAISLNSKIKNVREVSVSGWDIDPWSNCCDLHWEFIFRNKWQPATSLPGIALQIHFLALHGNITTTAILPAEEEASWLLLPSSVFSLSGSTFQTESTYFCILKVAGQFL